MRYFTKEQWLGWQQTRPTRNWGALWQRNIKLYRRNLERLRPRVPARAFAFFGRLDRHSLHDGAFVAMTLRDVGKFRAGQWSPWPVSEVEIQIAQGSQPNYLYTLRYTLVDQVVLDSPSAQPLFSDGELGLGSWGYDELTGAGKKRLRHEILFDSGSTLKIRFQKFTFARQRIS